MINIAEASEPNDKPSPPALQERHVLTDQTAVESTLGWLNARGYRGASVGGGLAGGLPGVVFAVRGNNITRLALLGDTLVWTPGDGMAIEEPSS